MLTDAQLASMRVTCELAMPTSAVIQLNTTASDGQGGESASWASGATVDCHVLPRSGQGGKEGGKPVSVTLWTILLPFGTVVTVKDRLVVGSVTYEIVDLDGGRTYPLQVAASCKRLD